jgi:hypothetical protein
MAVKVAAPPEPTLLRASAGEDPGEALIKEAKQRARRRRWTYGGAVVVVAIAAVAAFTVPGGPSAPHRAARNTPPASSPPTPLGAPLVEGPDPASTLLASWAGFHVGYVFIYADGRVIWSSGVFVDADGRVTWHPDGRDSFVDTDMGEIWYPGRRARYPGTRVRPEGVFRYAVIERHLNPRGLDLVRAGKLDPKHLLRNWDHVDREGRIHWVRQLLYQREELWAEPTAQTYEPAKYAICYTGNQGDSTNARDVVGELPAPAQALLNGKQRTYDPNIGTASWGFPPGPLTECFEVTAAESATLYQILDTNGLIYHDGVPFTGWLAGLPGGSFEIPRLLEARPVFPHGQPVPSMGG